LSELTENYSDYYRDIVHKNKNEIVNNFKTRNFDAIHPLIYKNELIEKAPLQRTISVGHTMLDLNKHIEDVPAIFSVFNT
jgi:hypothetical protein